MSGQSDSFSLELVGGRGLWPGGLRGSMGKTKAAYYTCRLWLGSSLLLYCFLRSRQLSCAVLRVLPSVFTLAVLVSDYRFPNMACCFAPFCDEMIYLGVCLFVFKTSGRWLSIPEPNVFFFFFFFFKNF